MSSVEGARQFVKPVLYQDVFRKLRFPLGPAIFSDMEYLTPLQMDAAASIEKCLLDIVPGTKIYNPPSVAKERFHLLRALREAGLSDVEVIRLDSGEKPTKYPVFIRSEVGCYGPETGLLEDQEAFDKAVEGLRHRGRPAKGRIALSFEAQPDADGTYRKYGTLLIAGRVIPQHVMFSKNWMIKASSADFTPEVVDEEMDYIRRNPHEGLLKKIFAAGGVSYGRIDYGFKDDKLVVYEINVNPTLPGLPRVDDVRPQRRREVRAAVAEAFRAMDDGKRQTASAWMPALPDLYRLSELRNWSLPSRLAWRLNKHFAKRQPDRRS